MAQITGQRRNEADWAYRRAFLLAFLLNPQNVLYCFVALVCFSPCKGFLKPNLIYFAASTPSTGPSLSWDRDPLALELGAAVVSYLSRICSFIPLMNSWRLLYSFTVSTRKSSILCPAGIVSHCHKWPFDHRNCSTSSLVVEMRRSVSDIFGFPHPMSLYL